MEQDTTIQIEVTVVLLRYFSKKLQVLTSEKGTFPNSYIQFTESANDTVMRICQRLGIPNSDVYTEQLHTFSKVDRDSSRRISISYVGIVKKGELSDENTTARWNNIEVVQDMKLDYGEMLMYAITYIKSKLLNTTIAQYLLPDAFSLTELENVYEGILMRDLDKRNFRKKLLKLKLVTPTDQKVTGKKHRPAMLYRFTEQGIHEERMI